MAPNTPGNAEEKEATSDVRGWAFAVVAIVGWILLAANASEAQQGRVPDIVLAQVLGAEAARDPAPSGEVAIPAQLVADHLRGQFQDQMISGVHRPRVDLEVHFDFDSDVIHSESRTRIEAAALLLIDHFPEQYFRVAGYTDSAGDAAYNQVLSERRAEAVWKSLVEEHGVPQTQLTRVGFGEDGGSDSDVLVDGRVNAQQRRVELQLLHANQSVSTTARGTAP